MRLANLARRQNITRLENTRRRRIMLTLPEHTQYATGHAEEAVKAHHEEHGD
jgi:hypothetical protein